jgi:hypothetical protein
MALLINFASSVLLLDASSADGKTVLVGGSLSFEPRVQGPFMAYRRSGAMSALLPLSGAKQTSAWPRHECAL